ncbi:glycoside hydrolase family 108 protein [Tepidicaulis sp. LMO-SS28]|uniref:glycoside hydrolase family 108 protein n=1 Tax=Tepidicaulis sp. LMO-SS28 TaxID=3447455 RepID=UPI003EDF28E3
MSAAFSTAIQTVLEHEGGYVNDPDDPGGATNWGISLRFLRQVSEMTGADFFDFDIDRSGEIDPRDIQLLTREDAVAIYREHWWDKYRYEDLPPAIGVKVFDLSVNMGAVQAHKLLQRACRAVGQHLIEDGILGPRTRAAVQAADSYELRAALRSEAAGFYRSLVASRPVLKKYLKGWLRRAYH